MDRLQGVVDFLSRTFVDFGPMVGGERLPIMVILLLGTGVFLTGRLAFVQLSRLGHGLAVTSGKYDDPEDPGDVSHFQALTTALSATVGIGNIAGVALAIHWGGPGALFWMWVTAFLGMATKFAEVTLAQTYRVTDEVGTVAGGPMYYIEKGLGPNWKWMAIFFAVMLAFTAFLTGNAVQAQTVADLVNDEFGMPQFITGLITATIVAGVVLGGIKRIGRVTAVLAPLMAAIYVLGALTIMLLNVGEVLPAFGTIFSEAFNPTAGVAGTGAGIFMVTLMWGVRRGLFSNEAGQGSAPIAHAAAKTDEPVSEGVVALLEPLIDTIIICTLTGLVIVMTGAHTAQYPTELTLGGGDLTYMTVSDDNRYSGADAAGEIRFVNGQHVDTAPGAPLVAWHETVLERVFVDVEQTRPFTGIVYPDEGEAEDADGVTRYTSLYGMAVESGAPLTKEAFRAGLAPLGDWGGYIVLLGVLLFGVSTAISWSYYGDRCAYYLFGQSAVLPYKLVYVAMHFVGATVPLAVVWAMGDVALSIVIWPNLVALLLLSPKVAEASRDYFARKPWERTGVNR